MAKLLIVLAAALLQVSAAPFDLNPFAWAFRGPKMGLEIASKAIGGVREGLENNNMGFVAGPLGAVQTGLAMPVGALDNFQSTVSSFDLPFIGGDDGFLSGFTGGSSNGLGGMFGGENGFLSGLTGGSNDGLSGMFAMPQKMFGQATEMLGGNNDMFDLSGMFGKAQGKLDGATAEAKKQVEAAQKKVQGAVANVREQVEAVQKNAQSKVADAREQVEAAQKKVQGSVADAKEQVEAAQKKVEGAVADAEEQVAAAQKKVEDKVADVQKQVQEQLAKVQELQKEVAPKAKTMVSTILADLQKQAAAATEAGEAENVEALKAQMQQVVKHANELMGKLQGSKKIEDAQAIADQFVKDFTPLFQKAQQ